MISGKASSDTVIIQLLLPGIARPKVITFSCSLIHRMQCCDCIECTEGEKERSSE
jgi:hypothetical protein